MSVCLRLDNSTAVAYINKGGGTRSLSMTRISHLITDWCEAHHIAIQAVYLPGALNIVADMESRVLPDSSDWKLHPSIFAGIVSQWPSNVDLFASSWNRQLSRFYAWRPQPEAIGTDAFSVSWTALEGYLFPPFGLIARCLSKIVRDQATVTMVTPFWSSSPWFPLLLRLASDVALILPLRHDLLYSPQWESFTLCTTHLL